MVTLGGKRHGPVSIRQDLAALLWLETPPVTRLLPFVAWRLLRVRPCSVGYRDGGVRLEILYGVSVEVMRQARVDRDLIDVSEKTVSKMTR